MNPINSSFQKIMNGNQYSGRTGSTGHTRRTYVRTAVILYAPPFVNGEGGNKENETKGKRIDRSKIEETNIPLPPPPPKKKK